MNLFSFSRSKKVKGQTLIRCIFILFIFVLQLQAVQLAYDKFTNYSSDGYSRDYGRKNALKVKGKKKSYKTYHFNSHPNTQVTLSFKMQWRGGWENSGNWKDYFKVYINNSQVINDTFSGSTTNWKNYSLTTQTDSSGDLKVEFYANTTSSGEYIAIDNVKISTLEDRVNIEKSVNNSSPNVGDIVTFSIKTTNIGTDKKIEMRDWIESGQYGTTPDAFEIVSYTTNKSDVTCDIESGGGNPYLYCISNNDYANNESFTTSVQARVLKSGNLCNKAYGYKYPWDTSVMDSSQVCLNASTPPPTDLAINSVTAAPNPVGVNKDIQYTITISNHGNDATNVELNTTISAGSLKTTPADWSCSGTNHISCSKNSTFNDGDSENVTFVFTAPSSAQSITLNSTIGSSQNDTDYSNNTGNTTVSVINIVENANDLCYEDDISSGMMCFDMGICSGGLGCRNTYHLKNIGNDTLNNVNAIYNEDGVGGSFGNSCGVNPSGTCQTANNINMGPFGIFGQVTEFNVSNPIEPNDDGSSIWTENFMSGYCFNAENLYAVYFKDGVMHRGKIYSCSSTSPPDENIPDINTSAMAAQCDTFTDMFQTHGLCSGQNIASITFNNAGQTLDGSKNIIMDNIDNTLNTCLLNTATWVKNQYETCGEKGDCTQTGNSGRKLNINYSNPPENANITTSPSSSTNDVTLSGTTTLNQTDYNNITTSWHTGTSTTFDITNRLRINSLKMTNDNHFTFNSQNPYSLNIGTIGIVNNGSSNTIATDNNAKNIKIHDFTLKSNTTLSLSTSQTIKMDTLSIGYGSTVTLKAQYININNFILDGSGSGDATINIIADYIDIGDLNIHNHSSGATITFKSFTSGKRLLFRSNTIEEGSNSTLILYSGNYYVNTSLNIPGTSDVSAMRAYDANQMINFYINSDLNPGNNPGINANGNNGNFGTNPAANFLLFINGNLTTGGGGTTINATVYTEGDVTLGNPTYIKGAVSADNSISIGQGQFIYDQNITQSGWGKCSNGYCGDHNLSEGFHLIDPDGGDDKNSFEIFCHQDNSLNWHEYIALPIKNSSNNFIFDNDNTTSNYYDTTANPREGFEAIEVDINGITYSGTLTSGVPKPHIPVVLTSSMQPHSITTAGHTYNVMGSGFSNINLIGTPFVIDWDNTAPLQNCNESLLRKALGQAVKYNTINTNNGTSNDGHSRCKITSMKLSLLNDYRYLSYNGSEVLQHSCKEMAEYIPNNIGVLNDQDIAGHFNILTSEPSYPNGTIPTTNGTRDNSTDLGANHRPITVYCKYQPDLGYVWTFLTVLDGIVTVNKSDLVNKQDTCSRLGLYFYVPNSKETFNRVRKYLKNSKTGINGWENYTGTIEEKIEALHPGNHYYLSAFRDVLIWPYGPMGVYYPCNGNHDANNHCANRAWYPGVTSQKGWMSGSPMHNIKTMGNYDDSMGKKGWVSILGSQDLNKTNNWWIADIGAGEEIGRTNPAYSPHGTHPIQSVGYKYYEPNGNYIEGAWLNFLFDSEGWIYHTDDWNENYPYYDYMCMADTNYENADRYQLIPGFFNAIEHSTRQGNTPPNFSDYNLTTKIVNKNISLDVILYGINTQNGQIDTTQLNDQNKSVGVFLSYIDDNSALAHPIKFLGTYKDFSLHQGRIHIPNFTVSSAVKKAIIQFYYCNDAGKNWTMCWNYNGNTDSPTVAQIAGSNAGKSDSYNEFAIRPLKFDFNITQPTPYKSGRNYTFNFFALNNTNAPAVGYNELANNSFKIDINETKTICKTGNFIPTLKTLWGFTNGQYSLSSKYNEVGTINIKIHEINGSEFAIVDKNDTNDSDRFIQPIDTNISFIPDHFNISSSFKNKGQNFTYISNDLNISAILDINITAKTINNTITQNYNSACYAKNSDVNISFSNINISPTNALTKLLYFETNTSTEGNSSINNIISLNNLPNTIFSTDTNGTGSIQLKINFDRNKSKAVNPFDLNVTDINVTDANDTKGMKTLTSFTGNSVRFFYGRVHAPDYSAENNTTISDAKIYYEVYCKDCGKSQYPSLGKESVDGVYWYINIAQDNSKDGNISGFPNFLNTTPSGLLIITQNSISNGIENYTITYTGSSYPYKEKIDINTSSWLIYNPYNQNTAVDSFYVDYSGVGGWAGIGKTGHTIDLNISTRRSKRIEW